MSQESEAKILEKAAELASKKNHPQPLDSLDSLGIIKHKERNLDLQMLRAMYIQSHSAEQMIKEQSDTNTFSANIDRGFDMLSTIIEMTHDSLVFYRRLERFGYIQGMIVNYHDVIDKKYAQFYAEEHSRLRALGYRPERLGMGLGVSVLYYGEPGIGASFMPIALLQYRSYGLKYKRRQTYYTYDPTTDVSVAVHALAIKYKRLLQSGLNDISLSVFEVSSPVVVNPIEFGLKWSTDVLNKPTFYYRPSVGIGWGALSISYAYDFLFRKEAQLLLPRHSFMLSIIAPFTNENNPKRYLKD